MEPLEKFLGWELGQRGAGRRDSRLLGSSGAGGGAGGGAGAGGGVGGSGLPLEQFVLVRDSVEADGTFVLHLLLAAFASAGHKTAVISVLSSSQHYDMVARKLGVPSAHRSSKERHMFVDVLASKLPSADADSATQSTLQAAFLSVAEFAASGNAVVIVDDLQALQATCTEGPAAASKLLHNLRSLTAKGVCVVGLAHRDAQGLTSMDGAAPTSISLDTHVASVADTVFDIKPLKTGHSRDVHGTMTVTTSSRTGLKPPPPLELHYKVLDSGVKACRVGDAAA